MMQPAENLHRLYTVTDGKRVPTDAGRNLSLDGSGMPGPKEERHSRRIVPISRSRKAFALGARTGVFRTRDCEILQRRVQARGEDGVAVVDYTTVGMIQRQKLTELLHSPLGSRVLSDVAVQDPARSNFHCDEDYKMRKFAVTETKKSQATTAFA